MMRLKIIAVGQKHKNDFELSIQDYILRMRTSLKIDVVIIKEQTNGNIDKNLLEEAKRIDHYIVEDDYLITLEKEGKQMTSEAFSDWLYQHYTYDHRKLCFVIGSSNGLHESLRKKAHMKLSFGAMTFPHHIARLVLTEQLYRAVTIYHNSAYHK